MPQAPALSLSNLLNSPASSSRKRSHAEITRSESRSASPDLPSKRRRTSLALNSHPRRSTQSRTPDYTFPQPRAEHDGYDYRRPVMSTRVDRLSQMPDDLTIDLTADSDDETSTISNSPPPPTRSRQQTADRQNTRAPPFVRRQGQQIPEVIDLSDDDDSDFDNEAFDIQSDTSSDESTADPGSPDIQIVDERPVPQANRRPPPPPPRPATRQHTPGHADRGPFGLFPDILRRGTQFMFGNVQNAYNEVLLDRLDGIRARGNSRRQDGDGRENEAPGDFVINLDYRQPAFALGGLDIFDRGSETPQVVQEPYKAPPAAPEGFTRTFKEEDVVLCPMCGDELAIGKSDVKQQVWVVKQCGHVYCGECATNRFKTKASKKDRDQKLSSSRSIPFQVCNVDDCSVKLTNKAAMFPIYL